MASMRVSSVALVGLLAAACASTPSGQVANNAPSAIPSSDAPIMVQKIGRPYQINGRWYTPARQDDYNETGMASWYGDEFHGRRTANGELFDMNALTAAHPTLPIPSYVQVTNLDNGRTAILRVNDRGPFARNRILDVSRRAADELGFMNRGTANVRVTYLGPRENELGDARLYTAAADMTQTLPPVPVGPEPVAAPAGMIQVAQMTPIESAPIAPIQAPAAATGTAPVIATPAPTVSQLPPVGPSGWFIQAGAFSEAARAEAVRAQLGNLGVTSIETVSVGGQTLHRVLVGPYPAELAASAARYQAAEAGFSEARLVLRN